MAEFEIQNDLATPSLTFDDIVAHLGQQASVAVNNGADQSVVEKQLQARIAAARKAYVKWGDKPFLPRPTKNQEEVDADNRAHPHYAVAPDHIFRKPREYAEPAENDFTGSVIPAVMARASGAARGLTIAGTSTLPWYIPESVKDAAFEQADRLGAQRDEFDRDATDPKARFGAGLVMGLGTFGTEGAAVPADVIKQGGSLGQAEGALAVEALKAATMSRIGGLGNGVISRIVTQAPAGAALGVAGRAAENQFVPESMRQSVLDPGSVGEDLGTYAAFALLGGKGGKIPEVKVKPTGDPAIDAGQKTAEQIYSSIDFGSVDSKSPFKQRFERKAAEKAAKEPFQNLGNVTFGDTPAESVTKSNEVEAAYAQRAREKTNENFAPEDALQKAHEITAAVIKDTPDTVAADAVVENNPLNTPEMAALKSKLQAQAAPERATMPEQPVSVNVEPPNPAADLAPKFEGSETEIPTGPQGTPKWGWSAEGTQTPAPPDVSSRVAKLREAMRAAGRYAAGDGSSVNRIAESVKERLATGTLTAQHVLDSVADNHGNLYGESPEARGFARVLREAGQRLGGLNVKVEKYDPENPEHQEIVKRQPRLADMAGVWDPTANKILITDKAPNAHTMVHEVGHAITSHALYLGEQGHLEGRSLQAYKTLESLYEALKPHLEASGYEKTAADIEGGTQPDIALGKNHNQRGYGVKDLHEFIAEMFSHGTFREHLKSLKLTPEITDKINGNGRMALGRVRNMYEAVVRSVRNMLGLSPKADNALDAMFSASHDFLGSFDNDRFTAGDNAGPDMSFLGEQAPGRYAPGDREVGTAITDDMGPVKKAFVNLRNKVSVLGSGQGRTPFLQSEHHRANSKALEGDQQAVPLTNAISAAQKAEGVTNEQLDAALRGKIASIPNAPKTTAAVNEIKKYRSANALYYANELIKHAERDPENADKYLGLANEAVASRNEYMKISHQGPEFSKKLWENADAGEKALAAGKSPDSVQLEAMRVRNGVRAFVANEVLPGNNPLKRNLGTLEEMYKMWTGKEPGSLTSGIEGTKAQKAVLTNAIKAELSKISGSDIDQHIDQLAKEIGGFVNQKGSRVAGHFRNMRVGDAFTVRNLHVPQVLRDYWGLITDPVANITRTLIKQTTAVGQLAALNNIFDHGYGKYLHDTGKDGFTEELRGDLMGPLRGKYTTPHLAQAIQAIDKVNKANMDFMDASLSDKSGHNLLMNSLSWALKKWTTGARVTKSMATTWNPGAYLVNMVGAVGTLANNGNYNPTTWARGIAAARDMIGIRSRTSVKPDVLELTRNGMAEPTQINEIMDTANQRFHEETMSKGLTNAVAESTSRKLLNAAKSGIKSAKEIKNGLYSSMDVWAKFANYFHNKDVLTAHYKDLGIEKSPAEIEKEAAERTIATNISYHNVPALLKATETLGVTQYAPYFQQVIMNNARSFAMGARDIHEGTKTGSKRLQLEGITRLAGAASATAFGAKFFAALGKGAFGLVGLAAQAMKNDDPRKKMLDDKGEFKGGTPLVVGGTDLKTGSMNLIDTNRLDVNDPWSRPLSMAFEAMTGDPKEASKKLSGAVEQYTELLFANSLSKRLFDLASGGNTKTTLEGGSQKAYDYIARGLVEMGLEKGTIDKLLYAGEPLIPKVLRNTVSALSNPDKTDAEKRMEISGVGVRRLDPTVVLATSKGGDFKKSLANAEKGFSDLMNTKFMVSDQRMEQGFTKSLRDSAKGLIELRHAVEFAKAQGRTTEQIGAALKSGGVPTAAIAATLSDAHITPAMLMAKSFKPSYRPEAYRAVGSGKDLNEVGTRSLAKMKQLETLLTKYMNKSAEQILDEEK